MSLLYIKYKNILHVLSHDKLKVVESKNAKSEVTQTIYFENINVPF